MIYVRAGGGISVGSDHFSIPKFNPCLSLEFRLFPLALTLPDVNSCFLSYLLLDFLELFLRDGVHQNTQSE